jgi:hypothetical protein
MNHEPLLHAKDEVIEAQRQTIAAQQKTIQVLEARIQYLETITAEFGTLPGDEEATEDPDQAVAPAADDPDAPDAEGTDLDKLCDGKPPPCTQLHWDNYRSGRLRRPRPSDN